MSNLSKQLKDYVEHSDKHAAIRSDIDDAKARGDKFDETRARWALQQHWAERLPMQKELLKHYDGDGARLRTDIHAYRLLRGMEAATE